METRRESEIVPENKPTDPHVEDVRETDEADPDPGIGPAEKLEDAPDEGIRKIQGGL